MNLFESVKNNLKESDYRYDWKKDIKDMEGNDDIYYSYAENMAEQYPEQYGGDVDSVLQQLICVWKIDKNSKLYDLLLEWYGSEEKLLQEVRNVWDTDDAIYFETGIGYSIFDADLLGGNADGETERKFDSFVQEHNVEPDEEEEEDNKVKIMAYGKVYYEYDKDEWENFTDEERDSAIMDTADQASEEEGHTVYEDEVEVLNESEESSVDTKEDYEVYELADSLISELNKKGEHELSSAIYKTLNGIDRANNRGAGFGSRLNKKLRELVKQAQEKLK